MSEEMGLKGSAIPEIYYDVIARVIPGALILGTYHGWRDLDLNTAGVGLILSYLLGLILDMLESPYSRFWLWVWSIFPTNRKTNDELWQWLRDLPLRDRILYTKMMAEKILFSSLSIGALLMCIFPPADCCVYPVRWSFAVAFVIFIWCMSRINRSLSANAERHRSRRCHSES